MAVALVAAAIVAPGCALVGPEGPAPTAPATPAFPEAPSISGGSSSSAADQSAALLLERGEARLAAGNATSARDAAREIVERYPEARGSSLAFWLEARAERDLGAWSDADEAAGRFVELAGVDHDVGASAQLLRAEVRFRGGMDRVVETLFELPEGLDDPVRGEALDVAREVAASFEDVALRDLLDEAPRHPWLLPAFQMELAERRVLVGDLAGGLALADAASALDPSPTEIARGELVREGRVEREGTRVAGTLAAILSEGGSPGLQQLSREIREGIEVALLDEAWRGGVRLHLSDDAGSPIAAGEAVSDAESAVPLGIVGPLTDPGLAEAARVRRGGTPIVSPTARAVPDGVAGVYSLAGVDPEAARVLAELAWNDGVRDVVVFHRSDREEETEFQWFREAFEARGGRIGRSWSYLPGTTTLSGPLQAIASANPSALVIFIPPEDVELVAPQLAFYGVDDIEDLRIYGSASWSSRAVLASVPVRHTDGVRTVATHIGDEGFGPAWDDFVRAYESHFQRTLRSPVPGLGWDAARILLEAASRGGEDGGAASVSRGLATLSELPGATGLFSFRDGRIVRHYVPVRIEDRALIPLSEER